MATTDWLTELPIAANLTKPCRRCFISPSVMEIPLRWFYSISITSSRSTIAMVTARAMKCYGISARSCACSPQIRSAARLGGDEFVLFCTTRMPRRPKYSSNHLWPASRIKCLTTMGSAWKLDQRGSCAVLCRHEIAPGTLLCRDKALYQSKMRGVAVIAYFPSLTHYSVPA